MEHQASMARKASWPKFLLVAGAVLSFLLRLTLAAEVMGKMGTRPPSQVINDHKRVVSQNDSFAAHGWSIVEMTPSGNLSIHLGSTLTLTCNIRVDSVPGLSYCWFFNGTKWANMTERHIVVHPTSWHNEGTYMCCVQSPANNLTGCASTSVRITADEEAVLEISAEVIVGAVLVLVAGIALIATFVYCLCSYIQRKNPPRRNATPSVYEDRPMGPQIGSLASKETKPEASPDDNTTYQVLQRGDEAVYQELEK